MSNFEINVEKDGRTNGRTNRKESEMPMSQSQVREMFHARFDGCLVL